MKSIIIASNRSGGGKTTVTLGIMKTLVKRGFKVQGYKVGPDYIDTAFHTNITSIPSRNLDIHLMGESGVKTAYSRGIGDYGIIEGVMGLYDGKGIDTYGSTAHISKLLNIPIILVLSPKAQSTTLCAEIKGMSEYDNANIKGIILNNISEGYYNLLKYNIEQNCKIKVLGYIPKDDELEIKSRHLGLIQSLEIDKLEEKIELCSQLIEKYIDVKALLSIFKQAKKYQDIFHIEKKDINIAVAKDKAFSFYYQENIELLEQTGNVVYFSPLKDLHIPDNTHLIYIGGGYPEVFIKELSENKSMLKSIKKALELGVKCYAECGGLMYLMDSINGYKTVGHFNGYTQMTNKLQNFGYANLKIQTNNSLLKKGLTINCHEFHKSKVVTKEEKVIQLTKTVYDGTKKTWNCGYVKKNTFAMYPHIHFFGNLELLNCLLSERKHLNA